MNAWSEALDEARIDCLSSILTREDFNNREDLKRFKKPYCHYFIDQVVPIVNENDSVSDEEIKFGDNDVLSALLASLE